MKRAILSVLVVVGIAFPMAPAWAAWPTDPTANVPVDTVGSADSPVIVADETGGILVVWGWAQSGGTVISVQHFDSAGQPQWETNGLRVCPTRIGQTEAQIVSDGAGGAIVVWVGNDLGTGDNVYAQRISAAGALLWGASGEVVCNATGQQDVPALLSDGAGGAIVVWNGGAQRLNSSGALQWTANGVATGLGPAQIASDGAGGVIATAWREQLGQGYSADVFAQRISAQGVALWGANGATVSAASGNQWYPKIASDGVGGAVIAWTDSRGGQDWSTFDDIYAQRLDAQGTPLWSTNGVPLCTAARWQDLSGVVPDGAGGAIMAWEDHRADSAAVFAQRIDGTGAVQWSTGGVSLRSVNRSQIIPVLAPDGSGGAFVAWLDNRSGELEVYGQRVTSGGVQTLGAGGVALSTASGGQRAPAIACDGMDRAVAAWSDLRRGSDFPGIYAQAVPSNGPGGDSVATVPPVSADVVDLAPAGPNPSRGGGFLVRFTLANSAVATLEAVDVSGRRIASYSLGAIGAGVHSLELTSDKPVAPGLYFVRLQQGSRVRAIRMVRTE